MHSDFVACLYVIYDYHERQMGLRRLLKKAQTDSYSVGVFFAQGFLSVLLCASLRSFLMEGIFPVLLMSLSFLFYCTLRWLHDQTFQAIIRKHDAQDGKKRK